jgi:hypothetical protein
MIFQALGQAGAAAATMSAQQKVSIPFSREMSPNEYRVPAVTSARAGGRW